MVFENTWTRREKEAKRKRIQKEGEREEERKGSRLEELELILLQGNPTPQEIERYDEVLQRAKNNGLCQKKVEKYAEALKPYYPEEHINRIISQNPIAYRIRK